MTPNSISKTFTTELLDRILRDCFTRLEHDRLLTALSCQVHDGVPAGELRDGGDEKPGCTDLWYY